MRVWKAGRHEQVQALSLSDAFRCAMDSRARAKQCWDSHLSTFKFPPEWTGPHGLGKSSIPGIFSPNFSALFKSYINHISVEIHSSTRVESPPTPARIASAIHSKDVNRSVNSKRPSRTVVREMKSSNHSSFLRHSEGGVQKMDLAALNAEAERLFAAHEGASVVDLEPVPLPKSKREKAAEKEKKLASMQDLLRLAKANDDRFGALFRSSSKIDVTRPENALPREYLRRKVTEQEKDAPEVPEPCEYCRGGSFCALGCVRPKESKLPISIDAVNPFIHRRVKEKQNKDFFMTFKQFKERRSE